MVDKATRCTRHGRKFLDDYLTQRPQRTGETFAPSPDDYRRFLAGKPDGVADFLAAPRKESGTAGLPD